MATTLPMLEAEARKVAGIIDGAVPADVGFTLMLFNFTENVEEAFTTYISSGERETMREVLRELLAKWDAEDVSAPVRVQVTKARRKWEFGR